MKGQVGSNILEDYRFSLLEQRIEVLEEKIFKKVKRLRATEAQKFLIFYHLGFVEMVRESSSSQNQKDLLVSVLLDIDPDNARKFLSEVGKKSRPLLHTESNYTFLVDFFEKLGHAKAAKDAEGVLVKIASQKGK